MRQPFKQEKFFIPNETVKKVFCCKNNTLFPFSVASYTYFLYSIGLRCTTFVTLNELKFLGI